MTENNIAFESMTAEELRTIARELLERMTAEQIHALAISL